MPLQPTTHPAPHALLGIWNDIEAARIPEYERWHTLEHVPERVWVEGFVAATRYVALPGTTPRYFTLYELERLDCLTSAAYKDLVDSPSPWSASMRPSFSNFLRQTYTVDATSGPVAGVGLLLVRARWDPAASSAPTPAQLQALTGQLLKQGAQACASSVTIGTGEAAGPQAMANVDAAPAGLEHVFALQTARLEDLPLLGQVFTEAAAGLLASSIWHAQAFYQFSSRVLHSDVAQPLRPAPRLDLMP
ncbi:MAG: hypothetical protein ABIP46_09250 [Polaromonas sp.]